MEYIITLIVLAVIFAIYRVTSKIDNKNSISFMETFNLTEMPIVTFLAGDSKINFLLDTGSTQSFISKEASRLVTGTEMMCGMNLISAQGAEGLTCKVIDTTLTYKDRDYEVRLFVNKGLDATFNEMKSSKGVNLHGVLGADFLDKHSYIVDFEKYLAYPKK